ncbi:glycoside hydrolase family 88/105 protein [Maribacter sp. CXY002]|uniref:glycoside hydrolase family 88/105 protein n=1 Tax=Maribacter luteocoastalis TaxID=3407671 RepID=UPI003B6710F4
MRINQFIKNIFALGLATLLFIACKDSVRNKEAHKETSELVVSKDKKWSERMALSEIHRFPDPTLLDFQKIPRWSYTNGLVLQAMSRVYEETNDQALYNYIYDYANRMIHKDGSIKTYDISNYNLDMIKSGDAIFWLQQNNPEERFKSAMDTLHKQLEGQPMTSEGGYWHKKRYPYQMWLDGVFMAEPFHTKYALEYLDKDETKKVLDKIVLQFDLIEKYNRNPETGLYYHGWDESKEQRWANRETGLSENFWSRGMGWYGMAMVDLLDYLPESHPGHERIQEYLKNYAEAIIKYQDESGTWYQVLDMPEREGNYLEATGSCMFTYTLAKGANKGYLDKSYMEFALKGFNGILEQFISIADNGVISLNKCCGVAGLGGDPYRDGSFDYYINEIIRSNDPKGTGPFVFAALELNR